MLLTQENLKTLKRVNVSKNTDKTRERVQQDFKSASKLERKAIRELSGQSANSIYRIYTTGTVNARVVLAIAQTLNVQPWYYTGEIDERTPLDEGQLLQFLKVHGYNALLSELNNQSKPPKRQYNRKPKAEAEDGESTESKIVEPEETDDADSTLIENGEKTDALNAPLTAVVNPPAESENDEQETKIEIRLIFSDEPQMKKAIEELTEQEAMELLHTLFIRARGGSEAAHIADVVKRCLLK